MSTTLNSTATSMRRMVVPAGVSRISAICSQARFIASRPRKRTSGQEEIRISRRWHLAELGLPRELVRPQRDRSSGQQLASLQRRFVHSSARGVPNEGIYVIKGKAFMWASREASQRGKRREGTGSSRKQTAPARRHRSHSTPSGTRSRNQPTAFKASPAPSTANNTHQPPKEQRPRSTCTTPTGTSTA